jgi:DNA-binding MarR family transcriptional regulator
VAPPQIGTKGARDERAGTELDSIERAIEQLFRLYSSRKVHAQRALAAGVVISQPGLFLLGRLQEEGELAIGELARLTQMDPAAAGRQIRLLQEDGLVERTKDVEDGRVIMVRVTPKGAKVRRRMGIVGERHMVDVLSDWSVADCRQLATLLPRFVDGLRRVPYRSDDGFGSRP